MKRPGRLRGPLANLCILIGLAALGVAGWLVAPWLGVAVAGLGLLLIGGLLGMGDR